MSKFKPYAKKEEAVYKETQKDAVVNFMEGTSYTLNPLDTLRMVAASSIFGEPSYYRGSHDKKSYLSKMLQGTIFDEKYSLLAPVFKEAKTTTDVFVSAIDNALTYDFKGTLDLAVRLRKEFNMRLNPSVIVVRASLHPKRVDFNKVNNDFMRNVIKEVILRPDDITNQFEYWMFVNGSKKGLKTVLKKAWADELALYRKYHIKKYKSKSLIDLIRICHANSPVINELMKTGDVTVEEGDTTWEQLRSQGKSWKEIFSTIKMPHMALLRNLRGIFTEVAEDSNFLSEVIDHLKKGVPYGKQFPFRYFSAYREVEKASVKHKQKLLDALEECIDLSLANYPKIKGKVMILTDNSGSAQSASPTEYGSIAINEIGNLSGIMTGMNAEEGYVGIFGDRLTVLPVSKRNGALTQVVKANQAGRNIGSSTENGIWLFFDNALKKKEHWDTIVIYSDQQAGHGGLYGTDTRDYQKWSTNGRYIDVLKLVQEYRKTVNPKVNVFSVQIAGYDNMLFPENTYRTALLAGWTGNEAVYIKEMNDFWDSKEAQKQ
jgi:hypothetical protein